MAGIDVSTYLARLGVAHDGPPSLERLRALHRAHASRIAYNTVDIHLGRPTSVVPHDCADRLLNVGRSGYCLHLNGGFSSLLTALGYHVLRHRGGVQLNAAGPAPGADGNHLVLTAYGLPEPGNPSGAWLVDVGLGDGLYDPLPLVAGEYRQGPFTYGLTPSPVNPDGWRLHHDPAGHFAAMDFVTTEVEQSVVDLRHEFMTTSPESVFVRTFLAHRRAADCAFTLRGCVLSRIGDRPRRWVLNSAPDWFGVLVDVFGLRLDDVSELERAKLWHGVRAAHDQWEQARRAS